MASNYSQISGRVIETDSTPLDIHAKERTESSFEKVLLLYDNGPIREMLIKYLSASNFNVLTAYTLREASNILNFDPANYIIIANSTVGGIDSLSILSALKEIKDNFSCIICTDMMDTKAFARFINSHYVQKILTFPLNIDTGLIPTIMDLSTGETLKRSVLADELRIENEYNDLIDTEKKLRQIMLLQKNVYKKNYSFIKKMVEDSINVICSKIDLDSQKMLLSYFNQFLNQYFISLSPKDLNLKETLSLLNSKLTDSGKSQYVYISSENDMLSSIKLAHKIYFILWMIINRLYLLQIAYDISGIVHVRTDSWAFIEIKAKIARNDIAKLTDNKINDCITNINEALLSFFAEEYTYQLTEEGLIYKINLDMNY